jgi:TldD protein
MKSLGGLRTTDTDDLIENAIDYSSKLGSEYIDIRWEAVNSTSIVSGDKTIDQATSSFSEGAGFRILADGAWGFAATSELTRDKIMNSVDAASKMARKTGEFLKEKVKIAKVKAVKESIRSQAKNPFSEVSIDEKINLTLRLSKIIKDAPGIASASVLYSDSYGKSLFLNSDGSIIAGEPSRGTIVLIAIAREGEKIRQYRKRIGVIGGFEKLLEKKPEIVAKDVADRAAALLKGEQVPGGRYTVVADPDHIGVFAHEAVGHATEADSVISGESILTGKLGKEVGSGKVTIYDDPTLTDAYGSLKYDSEGTPAQKRLLIDRGILRSYILNREAAAKLNLEPNGGARAQGYSFRPIPRMSNTYVAAGDYSFEEIIEDIDVGVYVRGTRGGEVDTTVGSFQFSAQEAFMIEKGKVSKPLLDVSLSGLTLETLKNIDAVGKDFSVTGIGYCGKGDQLNLPVGNGGPSVRIRNVVLGGA